MFAFINFFAGNILIELTAKICDTNPQPCGTCCGFCACGTCVKPDICPDGPNYCQVGQYSGVCCSSVTRVCTPASKCYYALCSAGSNSGAGACINYAYGCPPNTACVNYTCDNSTGFCNGVSILPPASSNCTQTYCDVSSGADVAKIDIPIVCPTGTKEIQKKYRKLNSTYVVK